MYKEPIILIGVGLSKKGGVTFSSGCTILGMHSASHTHTHTLGAAHYTRAYVMVLPCVLFLCVVLVSCSCVLFLCLVSCGVVVEFLKVEEYLLVLNR